MMNRLAEDGIQVHRSFDLQTAWPDHVDCKCPHQGHHELPIEQITGFINMYLIGEFYGS